MLNVPTHKFVPTDNIRAIVVADPFGGDHVLEPDEPEFYEYEVIRRDPKQVEGDAKRVLASLKRLKTAPRSYDGPTEMMRHGWYPRALLMTRVDMPKARLDRALHYLLDSTQVMQKNTPVVAGTTSHWSESQGSLPGEGSPLLYLRSRVFA